jgi:hypothetical protein
MNAERSGFATNPATVGLDNAPRTGASSGYIEHRNVIRIPRIIRYTDQ